MGTYKIQDGGYHGVSCVEAMARALDFRSGIGSSGAHSLTSFDFSESPLLCPLCCPCWPQTQNSPASVSSVAGYVPCEHTTSPGLATELLCMCLSVCIVCVCVRAWVHMHMCACQCSSQRSAMALVFIILYLMFGDSISPRAQRSTMN